MAHSYCYKFYCMGSFHKLEPAKYDLVLDRRRSNCRAFGILCIPIWRKWQKTWWLELFPLPNSNDPYHCSMHWVDDTQLRIRVRYEKKTLDHPRSPCRKWHGDYGCAQLLTDRKWDMSHQKEDCLEQNKTQGACNSVCAEMAIEIRRKMEELFCRLEKIENELEKQ